MNLRGTIVRWPSWVSGTSEVFLCAAADLGCLVATEVMK